MQQTSPATILPTNAERFLTAFNQIERYLRTQKNGIKHQGFKRLVDSLSQEDSLISLYKQDLIEFIELRNAIVHRSTGLPIAEPNDEAVARIESLERKLTHPPLALDIASRPVYSCSGEDMIAEVVRLMNDKSYTYIPVYRSNHFVGVLSENAIVRWLANGATGSEFILKEQTLDEMSGFLDQPDDKHNSFIFVSKSTTGYEIRDAFITHMTNHKRLGAVFVTEKGLPTEQILGIVTAWDIHKLSQYQQPGASRAR